MVSDTVSTPVTQITANPVSEAGHTNTMMPLLELSVTRCATAVSVCWSAGSAMVRGGGAECGVVLGSPHAELPCTWPVDWELECSMGEECGPSHRFVKFGRSSSRKSREIDDAGLARI